MAALLSCFLFAACSHQAPTTRGKSSTKPWDGTGFTRQRWLRPANEVELKANLKMAGFPKWWPRLESFDASTFVGLSRSASTINGKRSATYISEWRSNETDLAVAAALWRRRIPTDIVAEKTSAIEGSEQPGIDPNENRKYLEYVQRDSEGFSTATARVTQILEGNPKKVVGTIFRLQWDSPKESPDLLTDQSVWGWVKLLPPVDSPMTDSSLDVSSVAQQTTALVSYAPASATDAAATRKLFVTPASWSKGATFVATTTVDGQQLVAFRIGTSEGTVRLPTSPDDHHFIVSINASD